MFRFAATVLVGIFLALPSCKPAEVAFDCHGICAKYSSCFDLNYSIGTCETRCRERSKNEPSYRAIADECAACIDDKSCAGGTFNCGLKCSSVVP